MDERIAIVGAGQAGAALAMRLRAKGHRGELTVFGSEPHLPYQRPPLSKKYLSGEWEAERLHLRPPSYWKDVNVEFRLGEPVRSIDPRSKTLRLGDEVLAWDKLALTTGASPRPLAEEFGDPDGVFELRSLGDVDRIKDRFRPGRRLVIVGGGFIGLETAAVAAQTGLRVTVVEAASRILERVVCPQTSDHFRVLHARNGVRLLEGRTVSAVTGNGEVRCVELDDGERVEADLLLVGIGVLPNTELAQRAKLRTQNGILVDPHGRTSAPDVWAAGDCAAFPLNGEVTRLESVQNAIDQAEAAADDMLGIGEPYMPVPWFWSDQYDVKLQIAGLNRGYTDVVSRDSVRGASNWYFRDRRLIAVDSINDAQAFMVARKLLAAQITVDPDELSLPEFEPRSLLA